MSRDQALDLWIESRILYRDRRKRYSVGAYTRYPNKALFLLNDLEMPYQLKRRGDDLKFEIEVYGYTELADSWEDVAYTICLLIYQVIERKKWPHYVEETHGTSDK
jgi:hypothetical protein